LPIFPVHIEDQGYRRLRVRNVPAWHASEGWTRAPHARSRCGDLPSPRPGQAVHRHTPTRALPACRCPGRCGCAPQAWGPCRAPSGIAWRNRGCRAGGRAASNVRSISPIAAAITTPTVGSFARPALLPSRRSRAGLGPA
jgi:hypothetical protein